MHKTKIVVVIVGIFLIGGMLFLVFIKKQEISGLPSTALLSNGINPFESKAVIKNYFYNKIFDGNVPENYSYTLESTYTRISNDKDKDIVVTMISDKSCGTGGCLTAIFIQKDDTFEPIDFSYVVQDIKVLETITQNMHDLRINKNAKSKMTWNGSHYELETLY